MADIVNMPKLGFDMAEGTLIRWVVAEGEAVKKGAVLAEIETDKATVEVESYFDGVVLRHLVAQGTVVPVNAPIAVIGAPGESVDAAQISTPDAPAADRKPTSPVGDKAAPVADIPAATAVEIGLPGGVRASPLARNVAEQRGIDLRAVRGSGPGGRITRRDVENYVPGTNGTEVPTTAPVEPTGVPIAQPAQVIGETHVIPLTRLRSAIARRMVESTTQIPHFYVTYDYDIQAVMDLRKQLNALLPEEEKLSVNDFILKAAAQVLLEIPNLNTSIDLSKDQIIRHGQVNMGVAVALPNGLLTVVCRDAVHKSLRQIAAEVKVLVNRAREGKVRPDDIEGSTFTVSNLGMFGVEQFTAIINPPEAAILAVGTVREEAVVVNGELKPGMRMKATLSVDHRVSDGAEGAQFLRLMGKYIQEPLKLLL